ncbi:MAG: sigma factor, partial [Anaerococcus sp.]|nr:sigma factor [Anaerococcus sp.]
MAKTKASLERKKEIKEKFEQFYKTRDKDLRNELIEDHMYIVDILSNKYIGKGIEKDDLYQVASLGLIYAIDRYDPSKGYEFSSFATPTIMGELKRYF